MKFYTVNCEPAVLEINKVRSMPDYLNAWISPKGDCYFFEGAKHLRVATYIGICILGIDPANLKKGTYFNECWDGRLLNLGWLSIANLSWLSCEKEEPKFKYKNELSQKQRDVLFDYCQKHGFEYPERE